MEWGDNGSTYIVDVGFLMVRLIGKRKIVYLENTLHQSLLKKLQRKSIL